MNLSRRRLGTLAASLALAGFATLSFARVHDAEGYLSGIVFTSSNSASGNALLAYMRQADGSLALHATLPTGDVGSGAGLGSQGAVTLSGDGRWVFVVNAGGNSVSSFRLHKHGLELVKTSPSGGLHPISVTEHDGIVVVLNDGGAGNVVSLRNVHGELLPIAGGVRGLSAAGGTAPAQVGFSDDGETIVVSEKGTNLVLSYRVAGSGSLGVPTFTASPGQTPFGFAFNRRNRLVVTEAWGGAAGASTVSSYRFNSSDPERPWWPAPPCLTRKVLPAGSRSHPMAGSASCQTPAVQRSAATRSRATAASIWCPLWRVQRELARPPPILQSRPTAGIFSCATGACSRSPRSRSSATVN